MPVEWKSEYIYKDQSVSRRSNRYIEKKVTNTFEQCWKIFRMEKNVRKGQET